jgi:hypothetical protein
MDKYFKVIENDAVAYIGKNIGIGLEITEEEYLTIQAEIEATVIEPEPTYTLDEAIESILDEVSEVSY